MERCNHFWVERIDGYEEQCTAAICLICGEYGCHCNIKTRLMSSKMKKRRMELFKKLGFAGNNHKLEHELL